jgi:hypothetical protein
VAGPVRESSRQVVGAIAFDRHDRAWIAVQNGGLHLFDGKSWKSHADRSLGLPFVSDVALDRSGRVWVGIQNGALLSYDGTRWTEHVAGTGPSDVGTGRDIRDIAVDGRGRVWYLASGELRVYAQGRVTRLTPATSGLAGKPEAIAADGRGQIWVVTGHSISIPGPDALPAPVTELPPAPTAPHPVGYWLAVIASIGAWLAVRVAPEAPGTRALPRETWIAVSAILGVFAGLSAVLLLLHNLCPQVCEPLPQTSGLLLRFRVFATVLSLVGAYCGGKLGWTGGTPRHQELIAILGGILGGTAAGAFSVELWRSSEVLVFLGF